MINVVENKVYAIAAVAILPGELKTVPDMKNYGRERGLPITNKMKGKSVTNLLLKIGYAEEEYGKLYKKQGPYRHFVKLRKDIVDFARSYYLYEGGKNTNIPVIIELLLKNKLADFVEGIVFEKEPPVGPMTPELMMFIALNNDYKNILSRHYDEIAPIRKLYEKSVIIFISCLYWLTQSSDFEQQEN